MSSRPRFESTISHYWLENVERCLKCGITRNEIDRNPYCSGRDLPPNFYVGNSNSELPPYYNRQSSTVSLPTLSRPLAPFHPNLLPRSSQPEQYFEDQGNKLRKSKFQNMKINSEKVLNNLNTMIIHTRSDPEKEIGSYLPLTAYMFALKKTKHQIQSDILSSLANEAFFIANFENIDEMNGIVGAGFTFYTVMKNPTNVRDTRLKVFETIFGSMNWPNHDMIMAFNEMKYLVCAHDIEEGNGIPIRSSSELNRNKKARQSSNYTPIYQNNFFSDDHSVTDIDADFESPIFTSSSNSYAPPTTNTSSSSLSLTTPLFITDITTPKIDNTININDDDDDGELCIICKDKFISDNSFKRVITHEEFPNCTCLPHACMCRSCFLVMKHDSIKNCGYGCSIDHIDEQCTKCKKPLCPQCRQLIV